MKKIILLAAVIAIFAANVSAQNNTLLFGSTYIPQSNVLNPAFYPSNNTFYISLIGLNPEFHIPLSSNDIFIADESGKTHYINAWELGEKFKEDNNMFLNTDIHLFGFGLWIKNLFASFSARTKLNIHMGAPTGLAEIFANRFDGLAGKEITISDNNLMYATAYNEFAIGGGYSIGDLTVGARAKILNGICDFRTNNTDFTLNFNEDGDLTKALIDYTFTATGTSVFNQETVGDILRAAFSGKSWGLTLDLGAKYKWNMFEFSASILDIGKGIHWKHDIIHATPHENTPINFDHTDFGHIVVDNIDSLRNAFSVAIDSIQLNDTNAGSDYWTSVPTKLNLGATVTLGKMCRAGLLFHGEWDKNISFFDKSGKAFDKTLFRSTTSLVFGVNLANWVELMASMAVVKNGNKADWFNPGLGVNFSLGKLLQMYALVNYVSSLKVKDIKSVNLQFGINMMFGKGLAKVINND